MMDEDDRFEMQYMCAYCKCYYVSKEIFKEHKKIKHGKNSEFGYWKKLRKKSKKKKFVQTISTVISRIHSDSDTDAYDDDNEEEEEEEEDSSAGEDCGNPQEDKEKGTGQGQGKYKDPIQKEKEKKNILVIDLVESDDDDDDEPPPILTKMSESRNDHDHSISNQHINHKLTENKEKAKEQVNRREQTQTPLNVNNNNVQKPKEVKAKKYVAMESSSSKGKFLQKTLASRARDAVEIKNSTDSANACNIGPRKNAVDTFMQKKIDTSNYEESKNSRNNSLSQELSHVQQNLPIHQAQAKNSDKNYSDDSGYIDYENVITNGERLLKLSESRSRSASSNFNDNIPFDDDNDNNISKGSQCLDQDTISSSISTKNDIISHDLNSNKIKILRKSLKTEDHKCQICSRVFKSSRWLGNHLSRTHINLKAMAENSNSGINSSSNNSSSQTSTNSTARTNSNMLIIQDQLPKQNCLNQNVHTSDPALIISNTQDKSNFQCQPSTSTSVIVKNNHKPKPKSYFQYQYEKHDHTNYALLHYTQVLKNTKRRQLRHAKKERMAFKILKRIFIENSVRVDENGTAINKISTTSTNSVDRIIEEVIQKVSKRSLRSDNRPQPTTIDNSFKRQKRF